MGIVLSVILPLSLAFIMFTLGLGLTTGDFVRVVSQPRAFVAGAIAQLVLLPVLAFMLLSVLNLPPELSVGVMILSFCPGGVTSNLVTRLAGGSVALSVTLTGVVSLISVVTVPFLVAYSSVYFMGAAAPAFNVTSLALAMIAITAVPIVVGMVIRHFFAAWATRMEPKLLMVVTGLFMMIVVAAVASNWGVFSGNIRILAPALIILNILLLGVGLFIGRLLNLGRSDSIALAVETGVQNATLGITAGSLITEAAMGLPPFSLPSAVYGITMYMVAVPFIIWMRVTEPIDD